MGQPSDRDREVLGDLEHANHGSRCPQEWVRPLDVGGCNGSDESYRLGKLCRLRLAKRKQRGAGDDKIGIGPKHLGRSRGAWLYRITPAGRAALQKEEAGRG